MQRALSVDVHQHLLGEPLIAELSRRSRPPALVRRRDGWTFRVEGEPDSLLSLGAVDVGLRESKLGRDGLDRALVSLSSALGIESLPAEEAAPLLEAHQLGIEALPASFAGWGAVGLDAPDPAAVDAVLDRGCVGVSLPAAAIADPRSLERLGPLLERLERRAAPLFVHPGPVSRAPSRAEEPLPSWWPALTDYVAQMQAAWFAFLEAGRRAHPTLRVLFAMLAGGAPLQVERYAARRGEPAPPPDQLTFYDTSSYGPLMIGPMVAAVGADQLVYGSDRPVVDGRVPALDTALGDSLLRINPQRLLNEQPEGGIA